MPDTQNCPVGQELKKRIKTLEKPQKMSKNKFNGYAKWILIAIAIGTIFYNTVVTNVIVKNDLKHFSQKTAQDISEVKQDIRDIRNYLFGEK